MPPSRAHKGHQFMVREVIRWNNYVKECQNQNPQTLLQFTTLQRIQKFRIRDLQSPDVEPRIAENSFQAYILQLLNLPGASWNLLSSNTNLLNLCQNCPASIKLPKSIPMALSALVTSKCKEHEVECSHLDSLCFSKCKYKFNHRLFYISDFQCCLNTLLSSPPRPPQFIQRDGIFSTYLCTKLGHNNISYTSQTD
jgi:hypothetical protein